MMKTITTRIAANLNIIRPAIWGVVVWALIASSPAAAFLSNNLGGTLRLNATSSEKEGRTDQSLNQEYSVHWSKYLTPYLQTRASFRYVNIGIDQNQSQNIWREEYQPTGELVWTHPKFVLGGNIRQQVSASNNEMTDLVRNSAGINFATKSFSYPILRARYDWNHIYNEKDFSQRDSHERRFQVGLDYSRGVHSFYYNAVHRTSETVTSPVDISDWQHVFRWNQTSHFFGDKARLTTGYNFNYRSQTMTRTGAGDIYTSVPFSRALYAIDPAPDVGALDSITGLADGNLINPTLPVIDIGEGLLDRNIGVDFGVRRQVSGLYAYTDRPSSPLLRWSVYFSNDNLTWEPLPGLVVSDFNMNYNRYEIEFDTVDARYVKVVNFGVNDVTQVYITEIVPLIETLESDASTMSQTVHLVEMGGAYRFSTRLEMNADFSLRNEPRGDFTDSRNQSYYSLGARHKISSTVSEVINFQLSIDNFKITSTQNKDAGLSYNLLMKPLPTLEFSFAAMTRTNYINSLKSQETNNLFFQTYGQVLTGLNVTGEITYSRNNRFDARNKYDTWNSRISADSRLTRFLDAAMYYQYQWTKNVSSDDLRIRRQYNLDFNYRMTRKISIRGSLVLNQESTMQYFSQEYSVNWIMSNKLTVGALVTINESENLIRSERNNFRLNYALNSRTTVFVTYTSNEFSLAGRSRIKSLQAGLKMGF